MDNFGAQEPSKYLETLRRGSEEDSLSLRPRSLDEFIGQDELKSKLAIYIAASRERGEPLDHVLFYGPPGLGKTTLASLIAHEMGGTLRITSGPSLERAGDLAAILSNVQANDVLFIDEIHRLAPNIEEVLYPAMEDFSLSIIMDKGMNARTMRLSLPRFTLVGATTRLGLLTSPLRARFGILEQMRLYDADELSMIVSRGADVLAVEIDDDAAMEIGMRSRGTPRVALRLLRRVRDVATVKGSPIITREIARSALDMLGVDGEGLDGQDRRFLSTVIDMFCGGPVGLSTIAAALNEDTRTIEDIYEPYLIQKGLIERTPRGRKATRAAYAYMGAEPPSSAGSAGQMTLDLG